MTEHRRPLTCRLNVRHRWIAKITTDGGRYHQCRRCGKDRTEFDDYNSNGPGNRATRAAIPFVFGG